MSSGPDILKTVIIAHWATLSGISLNESESRTTWVTWASRVFGVFGSAYTIALPYYGPKDPLQQCGVRIVCFFYAMKLLDLALTKSAKPPKLLNADGSYRKMELKDQVPYVWYLLTDMRYRHFDIAVVQKGRPPKHKGIDWAKTLLPPVVIATLTYMVPIAETKCLFLLYLVQQSLEGLHTLLHFRCSHPLFYQPFFAMSLQDFWTTRWHASAAPFLQSLAYQPGKELLGRGFGVLAAFSLTGLWHGWASAALVDEEYAVMLGLKVWAFFQMLGVGAILERVIWKDRKAGMFQGLVVWTYALLLAGWCFRELECHSKISFLRKECTG